MRYAFVLGTHPIISASEIRAALLSRQFAHEMIDLSGQILLIETEKTIENPQKLLNALGGTIKIIEVLTSWKTASHGNRLREIEEHLPEILNPLAHRHADGKKLTIGISSYGNLFSFTDIAHAGMMAKKILKELGKSVRFVRGFGKTALDAGSLKKNNIIDQGAEICFIQIKDELIVGITKGVQDIDFYTTRDMGRPRRDMKIGMLPPKLAQILLNLAGARNGAQMLDPFCGIGTVIQEGIMMGAEMAGSDRDTHALELTRKNLEWLENILREEKIAFNPPKIVQSDARDLLDKFPQGSLDGIATESYLGPLVDSVPSHTKIQHTSEQLEPILEKAFQEFHKLLKPQGLVSITLPFYRSQSKENIFVVSSEFIDKIKRIGYDCFCYIPAKLVANPQLRQHLERRTSLLYARVDQIVGREIFVFKKIS